MKLAPATALARSDGLRLRLAVLQGLVESLQDFASHIVMIVKESWPRRCRHWVLLKESRLINQALF